MALSKIQSESIDLADNFAGMRFGGTASDNALDDYEEGSISGLGVETGTASFSKARYTKIGSDSAALSQFRSALLQGRVGNGVGAYRNEHTATVSRTGGGGHQLGKSKIDEFPAWQLSQMCVYASIRVTATAALSRVR